MLISIEGPDAVGKDTIVNTLTEKFGYIHACNYPTYKLHKDNDNSIQNRIRGMLKDYLSGEQKMSHTTFQIFAFFDKFQDYNKLMKYKQSKKLYLLNRYIASSWVYGILSAAKQLDIDIKTFMEIMKGINSFLVQPDIDVAILADIEVIKRRITERSDAASVYEHDEYITNVVECYTYMYTSESNLVYPGTIPHTTFMNNGDKTPIEVATDIDTYIKGVINASN